MNSYENILGKKISIVIDRPLGSCHPEYTDLYYPINYGYVEGVFGGDGEEQDVYLLGVDTAVKNFEGIVIAVIHRTNDVEDKWVIAPENNNFSEQEIRELTYFQEKFYISEIYC